MAATLILALQHISPEMVKGQLPMSYTSKLRTHTDILQRYQMCIKYYYERQLFLFELYLLFLLDITLTLFSHMVHNANNIELTLIK